MYIEWFWQLFIWNNYEKSITAVCKWYYNKGKLIKTILIKLFYLYISKKESLWIRKKRIVPVNESNVSIMEIVKSAENFIVLQKDIRCPYVNKIINKIKRKIN